MRLFAAIRVPARLGFELERAGRELAAAIPGVRAVPQANLHLTVRFFGLAEIEPVRAELAARLPVEVPETILAEGYRPFRDGVFAQFGGGHLLGDLCRACGADPADFTPHVTIARFRRGVRVPRDLLDELPLPDAPLPLDRLELVESELTPEGPVYTAVDEFALDSRKSASRSGPSRA